MSDTINKRKKSASYFVFFAIAEFLLYYLLTLFIENYNIIYYYLYFAERFILLAVPVTAAAIYARDTLTSKERLLGALYVSLSRLIFFIPFFYLEYVYGRFDSVESILLSLLTSVISAAIYFGLIVGFSYLIRFTVKKRAAKAQGSVAYFDMENPFTLGVFICSLILFVINLLLEIYSTVIFFMENGTVYYINELVLLVISYIFLAIMLIGIHTLSCLAANKLSQGEQ